jgi:hypothetical protein
MRLRGTTEGLSQAEHSAFRPAVYLEALRQPHLNLQANEELDALAKESDPELFFSGLIDFANRELNRERGGSASLAYQIVAETALAFPSLSDKARQRLQAIHGVGETGARVEYLLRDVAQQSLDPALLLAMGTAGLAYRTARVTGLSALASSPTVRAWLSPGFRSAAASLFGFAFEAPAFTTAAKLGHQALGRPQDWSAPVYGRELASSALVLGGLKLGGHGSSWLERRVAGRNPSPLFQQAGMLSGIYLGHGLEQASGLMPKQDGATTWVDSLVTLAQFNVAARLTPHFLTQDLTRWEMSVNAKNRGLFSSSRPLLQPSEPGLLATAGRAPQLGSEMLVLSSSHDNKGNSSPPPSLGRESGRSTSSKPPVQHGGIVRDALAWGSKQGRSSEDVTRMVELVERIRGEMWNALNLYVDKPLSRALGQSKTLYVRVKPVDGSLDNYEIELSATPTATEVGVDYVEFTLDANQGTLRLHELSSQAAALARFQMKGIDQSRSFLGYYRSILAFDSSALQSAYLVAAMPANVRVLVLQHATNFIRPVASSPAIPKFVRSPEPEIQTTQLLQYFPYIAEQARAEVEAFAENAGIRDVGRERLQRLVQKLLAGLHARESAEPRMIRFAYLQARMRPDPEIPAKRIFEILTPSEALKRPPLDNEVLFNLVRHPSALGDTFSYLNHIYLNTDFNGRPTRQVDLDFERKLGLRGNLKIRLDSLSLETFDLAAAQKWLRENGYIPQ